MQMNDDSYSAELGGGGNKVFCWYTGFTLQTFV